MVKTLVVKDGPLEPRCSIWAFTSRATSSSLIPIVSRGSTAANVLVGGGGNDTLLGGGGADILSGGSGGDKIYAGPGGDILIAGTTNFDSNITALLALSAEWSRTDLGYNAKIADLMGTTSGGRNGPYYLNTTTVHGDSTPTDTLFGAAGLDWFFAHIPATGTIRDVIKNRTTGEVVTQI